MFIASHEWSVPSLPNGARDSRSDLCSNGLAGANGLERLYRKLADAVPTDADRAQAAGFIRDELAQCAGEACELPQAPEDLLAWMQGSVQSVHANYQCYLEQRKAGAGRSYFRNRAHALHFLRNVAPTKLVDGAWLYGLMAHAGNARLADLVTTYVEELGEGDAAMNHVCLYRALLHRHGIDPVDGLDDTLYHQGLVQLALGWNADTFLPEVIGFNLGYEQLPLHLLITSYELNELGIDPCYFALHVTVDNADTGHARRACQAVIDALPRMDDGGDFWRRVREGAKLGSRGVGTVEVIEGFDIDREVVRIFQQKAASGSGAHSDYCKVAGRSVNDWLSIAEDMPQFLAALEKAGWIQRGKPVAESRFWALLQGPRAEMFGVFSPYELQVIHDWIRGDASVDGAPWQSGASLDEPQRQMSFRVAQRLADRRGIGAAPATSDALDADLALFNERYPQLDDAGRQALVLQAMSPVMHWTPVGLHATRLFTAGFSR